MTDDPTLPQSTTPAAPERQVGFALGVGVLLAPIIFVWFLLRSGYSTRKRTLGFIWLIISLLLAYAMNMNIDGPAIDTSTPTSIAPVAATLASRPQEQIQVGPLTYTFEAPFTRTAVGEDFMREGASMGGVLVVVRYTVKNSSNQPVEAYNIPDIKLIDGAGVTYEPDAGKTAVYATETHLDDKAWSNLNPGITTRSAQVFEIATASYDPIVWKIMVGDRQALITMTN